MIGMMQDEARAIVDNAISLAYFMRGGITYSEIMNLTSGVRDRIEVFLKNRLESEAKSMNPVY
jgi:hypothetical protein